MVGLSSRLQLKVLVLCPLSRISPDVIILLPLTNFSCEKSIKFGLFPFRSPLLGELLLFSVPPATEMFYFAEFAILILFKIIPIYHRNEFPHSEIPGS